MPSILVFQHCNNRCFAEKKGEIDKLAEEYIATVKNLASEQRVEHLQKIQNAYSKCKEFSDDKVQLAMQTYEMVSSVLIWFALNIFYKVYSCFSPLNPLNLLCCRWTNTSADWMQIWLGSRTSWRRNWKWAATKVPREEQWKVSWVTQRLFIVKTRNRSIHVYKCEYFPQRVSRGGWGRSVHPEEEEGKVLMKILLERKRLKTGMFVRPRCLVNKGVHLFINEVIYQHHTRNSGV